MNTHTDKTQTGRTPRGFAHAGRVVGIQGDLTDGMRRRIMAALRLSSLYVLFGRRSTLGALGAGAVTAAFGMLTPVEVLAQAYPGSTATGAGSGAYGSNAAATGDFSYAFGNSAKASNVSAYAVGGRLYCIRLLVDSTGHLCKRIGCLCDSIGIQRECCQRWRRGHRRQHQRNRRTGSGER